MEKTKLIALFLASLMTFSAGAQVFDGDPTPKAPRKKTALFNGKNYKGWDIQINPRGLEGSPDEVFGVKDGAMSINGKALGGCTTKKAYKDYHLTLEFRFVGDAYASRIGKTADGGLLFHCVGPEGSGTKDTWHLSFEYNIIQGRSGDLIIVDSNPEYKGHLSAKAYVDELDRWDPDGKLKELKNGRVNSKTYDPTWKDISNQPSVWPEKEYGEWNTAELICDGDTAEYILNGVTVLKLFDLKPSGGRIQLQSEFHAIEYRNIIIEPIRK